MNTFTFHPKMVDHPVPYITGTSAGYVVPKKTTYKINARYIRITPDPKQLEKELKYKINLLPMSQRLSYIDIKKFTHDFYSSIEWKFEEIDVCEIFKIIDENPPLDIDLNLHMFPKLSLTEDELKQIIIWYEKMNRETTQNIIYALFKTLDGRIMHLNGLFSYMELKGGSSCINFDPNDVHSPALPLWYNHLPNDFYNPPESYKYLVNLYAIAEWFNQHIS
jgi:hypothetical protein